MKGVELIMNPNLLVKHYEKEDGRRLNKVRRIHKLWSCYIFKQILKKEH